MQNFDKTLTTAQFNAYYTPKQAELSGYDVSYNNQLSDVKQELAPAIVNLRDANNTIKLTDDNISNFNKTKNALENNLVTTVNQRNDYQGRANSGSWLTRPLNRIRFTPIVSALNNKIININAQIPQVQQQINTLDATLPALNATRDVANTENSQLESKEARVNNNKSENGKRQVTLITQKEFYENREKACKATKELIELQKNQLTQYEEELAGLKEEQQKCIIEYEAKCSIEQHDKLTQLIAKRDENGKLVNEKQTEYDTDCKDKIQECSPLYSVFQQNLAKYDDETKKRNVLHDEYETCIDPAKNKCKDLYSAANYNNSVTTTNIDMSKSSEGFTQYGANDSADGNHAKLVANYKSMKNDYTKLKQNTQELNNANNNDNGKTSRYATKKQLYDNAIYTNILLTALATSMLYYVFVEI